MASDQGLVVHRNVALMLCENPAVLEEVLQQLDLSQLPHQRLGPRAIVAPAPELERLREALHEQGVYPRVVGTPVAPDAAEEEE